VCVCVCTTLMKPKRLKSMRRRAYNHDDPRGVSIIFILAASLNRMKLAESLRRVLHCSGRWQMLSHRSNCLA
jgi:hypothetical protein